MKDVVVVPFGVGDLIEGLMGVAGLGLDSGTVKRMAG